VTVASLQTDDRLIFKADWQQKKNAANTGVDAWNLAIGYFQP
jgi:hypothetical protein